MKHKVVVRKATKYPFASYWMCICGAPLPASHMGVGRGGVEEAFKRHKEDVNDLDEGTH